MDEQTKWTPEQEKRYREIRAIHWQHRTKEQKDEYEILKPLAPKPTPAEIDARIANHREKKDEPKEVIVKQIPYEPPKNDPETIVTTKEGLRQMVEEMLKGERSGKSILKDNDWHDLELPKQRKYTATLKLWQKDYRSPKGLVVDWKRSRFGMDSDGEKTEFFDVTVRYDDGNEEVVELPIIEFSRMNEIERVEIVSMKERKLQMKEGETRASVIEVDDAGISTVMDRKTTQVVPLVVIKNEPIATIRRANGQTMQLPVNRLNN